MRVLAMFTRGTVLVAMVVLLAALAAGPAVAGGGGGAPRVPAIDWQPCSDDFPGLECATAQVPLDYDRPWGKTTELALARVPASDPEGRIGSLFVNPGGPGGSGVALVLGGFGEFLSANLGGRFDVVGFDPRGVGASDPLHCFDSEDDLNAFFDAVPLFPYQRGQYRPFYDQYSSLAGLCLGRGERIAEHMSTADVVRDLDLLRTAVGDRKLSYLGFSYGSYIGNTYANLFPRNVRALVIDGVLDPRLWSSGRQIESDRAATQEVFDEFLRLCKEAGPAACAFWDGKRTAKRWETLARTIEDEPVDLGDGFIYTYDFLINDATVAMYSPEVWGGPDGYAAFLDFVADVTLGDQSAKAKARAVRRHLVQALSPPQPEPDYDNGLDAYFGNQCADTEYPNTFREFLLIDRFARAGSRFGPYWWWFNAPCAEWPVAKDRYVGPWTARTSAPVLVVGNFHDPATDYAGAQASNRLLKNSRLLSYAGWGHVAYPRNVCTQEYVDAYLLAGSLPPVGTVCPANPNPFLDVPEEPLAESTHLVGLPPDGIPPSP